MTCLFIDSYLNFSFWSSINSFAYFMFLIIIDNTVAEYLTDLFKKLYQRLVKTSNSSEQSDTSSLFFTPFWICTILKLIFYMFHFSSLCILFELMFLSCWIATLSLLWLVGGTSAPSLLVEFGAFFLVTASSSSSPYNIRREKSLHIVNILRESLFRIPF